MRVGIDCRKIADFGIGTYIRGLLRESSYVYVAFGPEAIAPLLPAGIEHVFVDAPHYSLRELFIMGRAADATRLDLFHAPHYVVPEMRTRAVVTIHDLIHLSRGPLHKLYASAMMRRAVRRARTVLTVSETVKQQVMTRLGAKDVVVTPNGIDEVFQPDPRPATSDPPYFLFVGNDKPHKNIHRAVAAFEQVRTTERLILAGAPFERFRGHEGITCVGFVDQPQLAALYRGAIALVMPSLEEGFGLPAAEAMACGTAVVTSSDPALVELTGDAALHVDPHRVDSIAQAMRRVMEDASLRSTLIERGVLRARAFTWSECARRTRDAYSAALAVA